MKLCENVANCFAKNLIMYCLFIFIWMLKHNYSALLYGLSSFWGKQSLLVKINVLTQNKWGNFLQILQILNIWEEDHWRNIIQYTEKNSRKSTHKPPKTFSLVTSSNFLVSFKDIYFQVGQEILILLYIAIQV